MELRYEILFTKVFHTFDKSYKDASLNFELCLQLKRFISRLNYTINFKPDQVDAKKLKFKV